MNYYCKAPDGSTFGPVEITKLVEWANDSRITADYQVSTDEQNWVRASTIPELRMVYLIETRPGECFGPFPKAVIDEIKANGQMPAEARVYIAEDEVQNKIVIDPQIVEAEVVPFKAVEAEPRKVNPFTDPALLESRLKNEIQRARQRGLDFSFLKR